SALPPTLSTIEASNERDAGTVSFIFNGAPDVRSFREDRSIVVDVSHDGAKLKIAAPAHERHDAPKVPDLAAIPAIAPPATVPAQEERPPAPAKSQPAVPPPASAKEEAKQAVPPAAPASEQAAVPKLEAAPKSAPPPTAPELVKNDKTAVPPAPKPDGTVVLRVHQSADSLRLEFPFVAPTPAAVFMRAETLWLVFDSTAKIDASALVGHANDGVRSATVTRGDEGEAILRVRLSRPRLTSIAADGSSWTVAIADTVTAPPRPLAVARSIVGKDRANIVIPFDSPGKLFHIIDPDIGDRLLVVTALPPARGFVRAQDYVELHALASTQGVAVHPIADDVTAVLSEKAVTFSRPGGLSLSTAPVREPEQATAARSASFDTQRWGFDRSADFQRRQSELIRLAAEAPASKRRPARLDLARFYLARGMSAEAKAVLDVALADETGPEDVTGSVLTAVADVMLDRPEDALKQLSKPQIGDKFGAPVWRAVAFARQGKWAEARAGFRNLDAAVAGLPIELQRLAMLTALHAALETGDLTQAARLANEFGTVGLAPDENPSFAVLSGRLDQGLGRLDAALTNYQPAAASGDRRAAAQGRLREIMLRLARGALTRPDAILALETLTTIWRGDETEIEGLKLLAHLYTEEGRYRDAFHVMRAAMLAHPNSELTRQIQDEAAATFDGLFLTSKGDALKPVEALSIFYDYRELTPIGHRGDEMIRRLADRLVAFDLLDQAAELLQHQIDHRLNGAARAQVATRLAAIYLMNRKPQLAISALQKTRSSELASELREQRLLLEARALSDGGRHDLALELIAHIEKPQAQRLRADILWAAKRWREAAERIELLYGERWKQFEPLNENERFDVLRAAIGYTLSDETIALARLRERYTPKFADGPDARAFAVVSAPIGAGNGEFQDVARRIAAINTLDAFLRDVHERYPDAPAAGDVNAEKAPAPPPAPADKAAAIEPPKAPSGPRAPAKPDAQPTGSIPRR
ncbi:MAG TPA: tetratricopeptide repeat protein, partial [Pseudolabrys sp.]|nr:tetratricopeptide repeat protein [Pseudolabrys sp.]